MNISIIGCGWLGLPLAQKCLHLGYKVTGTTTSPSKLTQLQQHNISPILFHCDTTGKITSKLDNLFDCDCLIITLPFKRSFTKPSYYHNQISALLTAYQQSNTSSKWIIFTSSTSVYSKTNQTVDENSVILPENERQKCLLNTENLLLNSSIDTTIVRCGGLFGFNRKIGNFFKNKTISEPNSPVNLIHCTDVIGIICAILNQKQKNTIFNAVCPHHPTKKELLIPFCFL